MKNITRLALAFAVAAIACLAPMAHADEAQLVAPSETGVQPERLYYYVDEEGSGTMFVKDGPKYSGGRKIYVEISQNGYTYSGQGWRSFATEEGQWLAQCQFWVYGNGVSAKFKGQICVMKGYVAGYGDYFLYGSGSPHWWQCTLDF
jgi:hypothetical protein